MRPILPPNLIKLAENFPAPLYVVGGSVRNWLAGLSANEYDWDICSPLSAEECLAVCEKMNFTVKAVYRNTGTIKLCDSEKNDYEYSCFRSDKYVRGTHVPVEIFFTQDIGLDARRRDFTANAVYYDIKADRFVDPLDGISAIKEKRLTTVDNPKKVFGEDGLRLMRLARQAAQLGFSPDAACFQGARENAALINDISPERIYTELLAILSADQKYGNTDGGYVGLRLLEEIGVLAYILPELTLGKGMKQRADFHKYDVLEHSLRAVKYATADIRLAALLHDVGKPFCTLRDGNSHEHPEEGARIASEILRRWKAPNRTIEKTVTLIKAHMYDFDCQTTENKLRRFFIEHYDCLDELIALKQADFSACMDNTSPAPTCQKWQALLEKMRAEGVPFTLKELAVNGKDILQLNFPQNRTAELLHHLLLHTAICPSDNEKSRLLRLAQGYMKSLQNQ